MPKKKPDEKPVEAEPIRLACLDGMEVVVYRSKVTDLLTVQITTEVDMPNKNDMYRNSVPRMSVILNEEQVYSEVKGGWTEIDPSSIKPV